jgi:hypothetical protein
MKPHAWLAAGLALLCAAQARAQTAPQPAPAPPASSAAPAPPAAAPSQPPAYPPPYYRYPGYAPPYAYAPPPPKPPRVLPYHEGERIPQGYYLEDNIRRGPLIAGIIVLAIPYGLSLSIAGGDNFSRQTSWLVVPALGPWIEIGARHNTCSSTETDCADDAVVRTFLVLDGLMQVTGAALLIWGASSHTQRLVREDVASIHVLPMQLGKTGYGLGAFGTF